MRNHDNTKLTCYDSTCFQRRPPPALSWDILALSNGQKILTSELSLMLYSKYTGSKAGFSKCMEAIHVLHIVLGVLTHAILFNAYSHCKKIGFNNHIIQIKKQELRSIVKCPRPYGY